MNVLVTGAAGYIGAAVCYKLLERGHEVVALDSMKYGDPAAIPPGIPVVARDIARYHDQHAIQYAMTSNRIEAVGRESADGSGEAILGQHGFGNGLHGGADSGIEGVGGRRLVAGTGDEAGNHEDVAGAGEADVGEAGVLVGLPGEGVGPCVEERVAGWACAR